MKRYLGNFETAQAITNDHYPYNAVIALRLTNGPPGETLEQALTYLQKRHPLLKVLLHKKKKRYFFQTDENIPEIPLKIVERNDGRHWKRVVEEELNTHLDIYVNPALRMTYLVDPGPQKENEMVVTFQHTVMDAVSGGNFIHELLSICQNLSPDHTPELFEAMEPLPPAEALFPPIHKGLRRKWKTFRFILRQVADEFRFRRGTKGKRIPPIDLAGKTRILTMTLPQEVTEALYKRSRKKRISVVNMLNAAMLMAVHKHLYNEIDISLRHVSFADLRPYLKPPPDNRYLGCYMTILRFTLGLKKQISVWDMALEMGKITHEAFKRGDKFYSSLLSPQMMRAVFRFNAFRMGATALSFGGPLVLSQHYGETDVHNVHVFVSNFGLGPEYAAQVRLFDRSLYWDIIYLDSDMDHEQARQITDEIYSILETAVKE